MFWYTKLLIWTAGFVDLQSHPFILSSWWMLVVRFISPSHGQTLRKPYWAVEMQESSLSFTSLQEYCCIWKWFLIDFMRIWFKLFSEQVFILFSAAVFCFSKFRNPRNNLFIFPVYIFPICNFQELLDLYLAMLVMKCFVAFVSMELFTLWACILLDWVL